MLTRTLVPRWTIAIGVLAILAVIGQWSNSPTAEQRQSLGFHIDFESGRALVTWVQPASIGWDNHLRPGAIVLSADGQPVTVADDPSTIEHAGIITFESSTGTHTASALGNTPTSTPEQIALLLTAACFALVGVGVFVLSNDVIAANVMLVNGTLGAILFEQLAPGAAADPFHVTTLYLSSVTFAASVLLLAWVFPINWLVTRQGRMLATLSMLPAAGLIIGFMLAVNVNVWIYEWLRNLSYLFHTAYMVGAIGLILFALLRASPEQRAARRAMGIVGLGMAVAVAPFVVLLVIPHFLGVRNLAPFAYATLGTIFIPLSLGIAITSRQFFGVTRLVRRGLIALITWLGLIALLSIVVRGFEIRRGSQIPIGEQNPFLAAILIAIVSILLWPSQSWLRRRAERLLFRDVYDYQETLQRLSVEIVEIHGLDAIATHVLNRLIDVLDLSWAEVTLLTDYSSITIHQSSATTISSDALHPVQVVPLIVERDTIGALSLGPKRHDAAYNPEDVALVTTLAPMVATALQSALLLKRLEEQVKTLVDREQQLAALSGSLMQVQEEERSRLALDLHDDPLQRAILLAREISESSPGLDRPRLRAEAEEIISSLRAICAGLRPPVLDDFGLVAGLESLVNEARARSDLNITLDVMPRDEANFGRLSPELETALYRVAQEALNNCIKHAGATSVEVTLNRSPAQAFLASVGQRDRNAGRPDAR